MESEEISGFLSRHEPFSALEEEQLGWLTASMEIRYFRRGRVITDAGQSNDWLSIVRSGAVELRLGGSELNARLGEGGCFGYPSMLRNGPTQNQVVALEDSLIYRVPRSAFLRVHGASQAFRDFFIADESERLRRAVTRLRQAQQQPGEDSLPGHSSIGTLLGRRALVTAGPDITIAAAARLMTERDVSTLPVMEAGRLVGIITDKDLRRRVLGAGRGTDIQVRDVMTPDPLTAAADTPVLTALLTMTDRHIHHLPVTDAGGALTGVISSSDLLARLGSNTLHIAAQIAAAPRPIDVADATAQLPQAMTGLVSAGVDADHISRFISSIGESAHRRLLALGEEQLGPPPVPYALVCFGSLARAEQALGSDQDNGFVFAPGYDPAAHDPYFAALARHLCDGLNAAGYVYCPGDIMATNPAYRRTVSDWSAHFRSWIDAPEPQAILESTIFFDMRALAGEASLVDQLRQEVFEAASRNRIFLSFVARAAAVTRVPLGFFRNFLLEEDREEHARVLNLKTQAIAPLVDMARLYALTDAAVATNSTERFRAAQASGSLRAETASDLIACFEFVRDVRFRHQAEQISTGHAASNTLDPTGLSRFDREHLRDAFKLIREHLNHIRAHFAGGVQ